MKTTTLKIISFIILIFTIPLTSVLAQEKKSEQKIKIIIKDGSDSKVIIDTVFTGDSGPDSLILKNGSVIHIQHPKGDMKQNMFVMSSDDKDGKGITREMTVISTDSLDMNEENGNKIFLRNDRGGNYRYKVITDKGDSKENMVWVESRSSENENDDTFTMHVTKDEFDSDMDKSRFVIARDGIVVTVEGTDEAKTKELAKEIEKKLGVTGKEDKKEATKGKSEKTKK